MKSRWRPFIAAVAIVFTIGAVSSAVVTSASATTYTPTFASWGSSSSGAIGSTTITVSSALAKVPFAVAFTGANFVPAASLTDALDIGNTSGVAMTFGSALTNPALYLKGFEGQSGPVGVDSYSLSTSGGSCTWSIVSGFAGASISGSTLTLADGSTNNGIVLCTGSTSGITVSPIGSGQSRPAQMTLATLAENPDPTTSTSTTTPVGPTTTTPPDGPTTTTPPGDLVTPSFTG